MTDPILSKTCSVCGLQKPLSAFLQLAGPAGASYGNVCASCRKAHLESLKQPKDWEGTTSASSGKKIDAKARLAESFDKLEEHKQKEEAYREKEQKSLGEKEARTKQLDREQQKPQRRSSFLDSPAQKAVMEKASKEDLSKQVLSEQAQSNEKQKEQQIAYEEEQKKEINPPTARPAIDTYIAGKIKNQSDHLDTYIPGKLKYQSERFQNSIAYKTFKSWIGKDSKIAKGVDEKAPEQNAEEYIEKHNTPKSGRGR